MPNVAACPNCGHADIGAICPVCDCGDETSVIGPHNPGLRPLELEPFYDERNMRLKRCGHHIGTRTCVLPVGHDGIHIARG